MESLGFIDFWGHTPAIDFLTNDSGKETTNVLLNQTSDIRHILKSLADHASQTREAPLNIYIRETNLENIARCLLLLAIVQNTEINSRQRMERYLDIYANTIITEKDAKYIDSIIPMLISIITSTSKIQHPIKALVNIEPLKFKERDELEVIFKSYGTMYPFDIEKLRDQRLRYHFKDRYDVRLNLADWDYYMKLKPIASIIHIYLYKKFRQTGICFETRFEKHNNPNRTLGSYIEGKQKRTYDSILVRGFWGDIINSPYFSHGVEVTRQREKDRFYVMYFEDHKFVHSLLELQ